METNPVPLLYSVADTARMLGIGKVNLYRLIGEGQLDARALGGRTLITNDSIQAFIAGLPKAAPQARFRTSESEGEDDHLSNV